MFKLDRLEQEEIMKTDIICLNETWQTKTPEIPAYLQNDHVLLHEVPAVKEKHLGRPRCFILGDQDS